MKTPFNSDKYLKIQRENILKGIGKFGDKLYLEFGGKLFDYYHASRVLPGLKQNLKQNYLHKQFVRLKAEEILLALSIQALNNPLAELTLKQLPKLKGSQMHSSTTLSQVGLVTLKRLGIDVIQEAQNYQKKLYFKG